MCLCLQLASLFPGAIKPALPQENYKIKKFQLQGVRQIPESGLREVLYTKAPAKLRRLLFWKDDPLYNSNEFKLDLQRIRKFYQLQGFFQARVIDHQVQVSEEEQAVRITVAIEENQPARIGRIHFVPKDSTWSTQSWPDLNKAISLRPREPVVDARITSSRFEVVAAFANFGQPNARVETRIERDDKIHLADVFFIIDPDGFYEFGTVQISGTKYYPQRVIRKELPFKTGRRFDQSKLSQAQQKVYRLELFQSVRIRGVIDSSSNGQIPIEIKVEEAPRHTLKVGLGFGTEERVRTTINWRRRNFLGDARRLQTEMKYSRIEPGRIQVRLIQPHVPDAKSSIEISPYLVRQDEKGVYKVERLGAEILTQRRLGKTSDGFVRYRYERVRLEDTSSTAANDFSVSRKSIVSLGLFRNTSKPLFSPNRGTLRSLVIDWSGLLFNANYQYLKGIFEYRHYQELMPRVVLASRMEIGAIRLLGDITPFAPIEERFYAGGSTSIRGWRRLELGPRESGQPIGGNSLIESSAELRFPIWKQAGGVIFLDAGNAWRTTLKFPLNELHYSAGTGLRYDTPIGPARLDVAWKLNRQSTDAGRFEFHLSIGQAF